MDSLTDWPEPIVRVQSLSDTGEATIPPRYIKPPSDRPCFESAAPSKASIPVVDLGGADAASAVSSASREFGFFQAVNHGVNPKLMHETREIWRAFFHLPMEAKQAYANSPKTYEGYGSRLGIEKGVILDWGDYYFLHFSPLKTQDKYWPALPVSLRETVEEYGRGLRKLSERVMELLSVGLGMDRGRMQEAIGGEDVGVCFRVNYYPKCPQPDLTLGLSSHSDPGGITVLLPDDRVRGLQVRHGGEWVTVQVVTDAFIVNVGDQVQILSNGIYQSVEHRVVVNSVTERLSMAFFYNPRSDLPLGPLPELLSPAQPSSWHQPMTFDQYRLYIRKRGPHGKSQLQSLKTI